LLLVIENITGMAHLKIVMKVVRSEMLRNVVSTDGERMVKNFCKANQWERQKKKKKGRLGLRAMIDFELDLMVWM
jgi:hypothetical protein